MSLGVEGRYTLVPGPWPGWRFAFGYVSFIALALFLGSCGDAPEAGRRRVAIATGVDAYFNSRG